MIWIRTLLADIPPPDSSEGLTRSSISIVLVVVVVLAAVGLYFLFARRRS